MTHAPQTRTLFSRHTAALAANLPWNVSHELIALAGPHGRRAAVPTCRGASRLVRHSAACRAGPKRLHGGVPRGP